jgi:hypothetical protein
MTHPRRHWFSFSLRMLLIITSAICCLLAFALVRQPTSLQILGAGLAVGALVAPATLYLISATPKWRKSRNARHSE